MFTWEGKQLPGAVDGGSHHPLLGFNSFVRVAHRTQRSPAYYERLELRNHGMEEMPRARLGKEPGTPTPSPGAAPSLHLHMLTKPEAL